MSLFPKVNSKVEAGRVSSCQNCYPRRGENADRGVKGKYGCSAAGGVQGCCNRKNLMSQFVHFLCMRSILSGNVSLKKKQIGIFVFDFKHLLGEQVLSKS